MSPKQSICVRLCVCVLYNPKREEYLEGRIKIGGFNYENASELDQQYAPRDSAVDYNCQYHNWLQGHLKCKSLSGPPR